MSALDTHGDAVMHRLRPRQGRRSALAFGSLDIGPSHAG
jgi:hypothetical protein